MAESHFLKVSRPAPTTCPVCSSPLRISRLDCESCKTAIEGNFDGGRLGRLSREQRAFVEVFLECRGKIKDTEQRLGISYPTVVSRLDHVVQAMGAPHDVEALPAAARIDAILAALSRGEITPAEAAVQLKAMRERT
ncbi:DUF2089 domain-containing protein [Pendulispora albinea]|uniref:DUF2089 domain-containing protein n=1 Tax=Pendulispora albinea TaxID=2741071 RepID=A0ABZ2M289_9BACT